MGCCQSADESWGPVPSRDSIIFTHASSADLALHAVHTNGHVPEQQRKLGWVDDLITEADLEDLKFVVARTAGIPFALAELVVAFLAPLSLGEIEEEENVEWLVDNTHNDFKSNKIQWMSHGKVGWATCFSSVRLSKHKGLGWCLVAKQFHSPGDYVHDKHARMDELPLRDVVTVLHSEQGFLGSATTQHVVDADRCFVVLGESQTKKKKVRRIAMRFFAQNALQAKMCIRGLQLMVLKARMDVQEAPIRKTLRASTLTRPSIY